MTAKPLALGLVRDRLHRYSWMGGPFQPGVTSVTKCLDKSGPLVGWAQRETAAAAVRNIGMLQQMIETGGPQATIDWLKKMPGYQRDTAADLGTRIHALAESIARGHEPQIAEDEAPFVTSYLRWQERAKPRFRNVEFMVYSEQHRYGGTCDAVLDLPDGVWLVDYKTGKAIYGEVALQLVGYARADFAGRPGDPKRYRVPAAAKFGVLHIRPEGAELVPYALADDDWEAFLACRRLYDWLAERAPIVKQEAVAA